MNNQTLIIIGVVIVALIGGYFLYKKFMGGSSLPNDVSLEFKTSITEYKNKIPNFRKKLGEMKIPVGTDLDEMAEVVVFLHFLKFQYNIDITRFWKEGMPKASPGELKWIENMFPKAKGSKLLTDRKNFRDFDKMDVN